MTKSHSSRIAHELKVKDAQVSATIRLLDENATVPFIARYRKEATGSLDEVQITFIRDRFKQLRDLDERRESILKSLTERELLTDELSQAIAAADAMAELEDIYLPYKPKKRTRASIARERGLEPLAEIIFDQDDIDPRQEAEAFISPEQEVPDIDAALQGARDIIAEWINEDADARARIRRLFAEEGIVYSTVVSGKEADGAKYSDYFAWEEPVKTIPSHRILAMRRGEKEEILRLKFAPPEDSALSILNEIFVIDNKAASLQIREAIADSYQRLLAPSMATELRGELRERADAEAIRVFAANLRELLMFPPLGQKRVLAIDPGFRTGCKIVCLDKHGSLLDNTAVFPHNSDRERDAAGRDVLALVRRHKIQVIAIGNGTAGRETEAFVKSLDLPDHVQIEMVNEAGASVYSASDVARKEFPDQDITVRGAVSIGRRLMDPLAELVKIDPKSIGVGQYQHDVDQSNLRAGLDDTVMSCVNNVGVEVNTASGELLSYVSGVGPGLAQSIVQFRADKGAFRSRATLLKVPRLGPKAFEQAAGFLRIHDADNPLDRSAVHPESYSVVERMAADLGCTLSQLMSDDNLRKKIKLEHYVTDSVGMPTLIDIMDELAKPGRDPRQQFESFSFDDSVTKMDDLKAGMSLPGIVTNVTAFGAFVDIGVHQDGLVHISEMADKYVKDPNEIVKVHQRVRVTVLDVDLPRKRIALSLRQEPKT